MNKIIIVGSGPVGSFMAVLCAFLGYNVTVYEKREEFTRNINLKIENNFFGGVHDVISRLNITSDFFLVLNNFLLAQNNKVLIKDLELRFSQQAKLLGALYIRREVNSFREIFHEHDNRLVLDCTGRNSNLRVEEFGRDEDNVVSTSLQNAMYLNFKANVTGSLSLYQTMKYMKDIKLSEVIVSRHRNEDGFSNVTIPAFITDGLARVFDQEFPDISRNPVNPFNTSKSMSNKLFFPISSLLGNLLMDGCLIDLNSVSVKKIEISCGYAKRRSRNNLVCLGDSAVHLAFFKSLYLGLKHGLEFFVQLSILRGETNATGDVLSEFKRDNPLLNPVKLYRTKGGNVFLVVTKIILYGCFSYCYTNRKTIRLTNQMGVTADKIQHILEELNRQQSSWNFLLKSFETNREHDVMLEVASNKEKNVLYDHTSWMVNLDGKSVIKISEVARVMSGKHLLVQNNFEFLLRLFEERRSVIVSTTNVEGHATLLVKIITKLLRHGRDAALKELFSICSSDSLSDDEKVNLLSLTAERLVIKTSILGVMVDMSAASVGASSKNDNINSQFILKIVKNEIATSRSSVIEADRRHFAESSFRKYVDLNCSDDQVDSNLSDDIDLITF